MAADQAQIARSLGDTVSQLARRWATQRLEAVHGYGRILSDYGQGRATGRAAAQAYAKLAMEEAVRYPADAFGIATDYASAVARAAGLNLGAVKTTTHRAVLDVDLGGPLGGTASREFVLENPHDVAAEIGFIANNFSDGDSEIKAKPSFAPGKLTIAPHGEHVIRVSTRLDARKFAAGQSYRANVAVEGFDDMVVRVHLTVAD